jgi:hypothetical protein
MEARNSMLPKNTNGRKSPALLLITRLSHLTVLLAMTSCAERNQVFSLIAHRACCDA